MVMLKGRSGKAFLEKNPQHSSCQEVMQTFLCRLCTRIRLRQHLCQNITTKRTKKFNAQKLLLHQAQSSNFLLDCVTILQDRVVMNQLRYPGFREWPLVINVNLLFMCAASLYVLKFSELVVVSFMSVSICFHCPTHSPRVFTHWRHWAASYQGNTLQLI